MEFWRSRSLWITLIVLLGVGLWCVPNLLVPMHKLVYRSSDAP